VELGITSSSQITGRHFDFLRVSGGMSLPQPSGAFNLMSKKGPGLSLFRKEVLEHRTERLQGDVGIALPLSWQIRAGDIRDIQPSTPDRDPEGRTQPIPQDDPRPRRQP
jgi:hypothetical protein